MESTENEQFLLSSGNAHFANNLGLHQLSHCLHNL